jgi:hypothetical protein
MENLVRESHALSRHKNYNMMTQGHREDLENNNCAHAFECMQKEKLPPIIYQEHL